MNRLLMAVFGFGLVGLCSGQQLVRWEPDSSESSQAWSKGVLTRTIGHGGAWVMMSMELSGGEVSVKLGVLNERQNSFDVLPSKITALETATGRPLKVIDKAAAMLRSRRWQAAAAALSGANAGLQDVNNTRSTATVTDSDGNSSTVYVQTPNGNRNVDRNNRQVAENRAALDSLASQYDSVALKAETVYPGQFVKGFVWLSKPKGKLVTVRIPMGGEIYEFSFDLALKP